MCFLFVYKKLLFHICLALFSFYANPSYNSRYSILRNLCFPNIRISQSRQSIDYLGPAFLNSMPFEIKEVEDPSTFKNTVEISLSHASKHCLISFCHSVILCAALEIERGFIPNVFFFL